MKYKIIGFVLIITSLGFLTFRNITELFKNRKEIKIINEMNYNKPELEYAGYIYIPKIQLKKLIKYGTNREILDENYVGILSGKTLENKNIVLAGHNIQTVFKELKNLNIGDEIILNTIKKVNYYKVYKIVKINPNEFKYFYDANEEILTLVTCADNNTRRLLIICKLYYQKVL